jgi:hypothetical protein
MKTNGYQGGQRLSKRSVESDVEWKGPINPSRSFNNLQPPAPSIVTVPASLLHTIGRADSVYPTTCFPACSARTVEMCQCTCHSLLS